MKGWLQIALEPRVVRRSLKYAAVVGAVLIAINHGDAIWSGAVEPSRLFRIGLTVLVPYVVSTASSVGAIRDSRRGAVLMPPSATTNSGSSKGEIES